MQKQKRGNLEKRLPAAGRGDHITIASRGGRDCATVHVSPMRSCSEFISENIQRIFSGIYSSLRKGTKKDPAGGGVTPASLRAVHSGRIMGQEAVSSGA